MRLAPNLQRPKIAYTHISCTALPNRLYRISLSPCRTYPWPADESGYVSCCAARKVWEKFGIADRMGWSFQAGHGHCMLPEEQWPDLEAFVDIERWL